MPQFLQAVAFALCLAIIFSDLYERRVRNAWLMTALLAGFGWLVWFWIRLSAGPLLMAVTGLAIGLTVLLPFYAMRWMGAGDVKFFAVLGFLLGGKALLPIWMIASLLGGLHGVVLLLYRYLIRRSSSELAVVHLYVVESGFWRRVVAARNGRNGLPYAAYMAIGALLTMAFTNLTHW